jgi:hypothetical protein
MERWKELPKDSVIEVGDLITYRNTFGINKQVVSRVTKTMAICRINDRYDMKFKRIYDFYFAIVPRPDWDNNEYKAYRKLEDEDE